MFILYREVSEFFALIFYLKKNYIFLYKENRWPMTASFREKRIYRYLAGIPIPSTNIYVRFREPPPPVQSIQVLCLWWMAAHRKGAIVCRPISFVSVFVFYHPLVAHPPAFSTHTHIFDMNSMGILGNTERTHIHTHTHRYTRMWTA